jgi:hypothetical protein
MPQFDFPVPRRYNTLRLTWIRLQFNLATVRNFVGGLICGVHSLPM